MKLCFFSTHEYLSLALFSKENKEKVRKKIPVPTGGRLDFLGEISRFLDEQQTKIEDISHLCGNTTGRFSAARTACIVGNTLAQSINGQRVNTNGEDFLTALTHPENEVSEFVPVYDAPPRIG